MNTSLSRLLAHHPSKRLYKALLCTLNKAGPDDEPLSLLVILDSTSLADALWCLRAVEGFDAEKRLFAVWCARQAPQTPATQATLEVVERFANGTATPKELAQARRAADRPYASRAAHHCAASAAYLTPTYATPAIAAAPCTIPAYLAAHAKARKAQATYLRSLL